MNLQPTDIITKQSNGKESLWVSQRYIMQVCSVDDSYLKVARFRYKQKVRKCDLAKSKEFLPDNNKGWRYADTNNGFYYCYDNIPDTKPANYRSKIGSEQDLKNALNQVSSSFKVSLNDTIKSTLKQKVNELINNDDVNYYMYDSNVLFNREKATELAKAKAWCIFIKEQYASEGFKTFGIQKKNEFLNICTDILTNAFLEGLKVTSPAYLRNKIDRFPAEGLISQRDFLISEKFDNDNARKVGKSLLFDAETGEEFKFDAHEALMYYGYMNPGGSSKEDIRTIYTDFYYNSIIEWGHQPIAYRTFCHYLGMLHNELLTAKERHGVEYYKKTQLTYIPQKKLQYSHSLFCGDGSGTIQYKYYKTVKGKEVLSTMKLYVILIADVASRQIVGWAPSLKGFHSESPEMTENAVKMAVKNCDYQTMFEFVSDNHGSFTSKESKEILNTVFNKVRTIEAGNSQSNPAETEFRLFKKTLKGLSNFGSTSWGVGIEGQSNPDYLDIQSFPTYENAILQFAEIVEKWNNTKLRDGISPAERFVNKNPKCNDIDPRIIRKIFANHTKVDLSYMRGFVNVAKTKGYETIEKYQFEIPDYWDTGAEILGKATNYRKNIEVKVIWNEEMADLYTLDGKFIISCPPALKSSSSEAESDDQSKYALGHHQKRKENQLAKADEFLASLQDAFGTIDQDLPYEHQMALGGNKESFNGKMNTAEGEKLDKKAIKKQRIDRDFDENEWS